MATKILNYINVYRAIAIMLIVLQHYVTYPPRHSHILMEMVGGGTILFIFISGFLFQHLSYKFNYKEYLHKKLINVNSPYLITSIVGIIIVFCVPYANPFYGLNYVLQIFILLSLGVVHNFATWYIPVINIFFLLAPFFLWLNSKKINKINALHIVFFISLLVTLFVTRIPLSNKEVASLPISYVSKYLIYINYLAHNFLNIFSAYILGMIFADYKNLIPKIYTYRVPLWIIFFAISITDSILCAHSIYCNISLSKIILTILLLGYLFQYDNIIQNKQKLNNMLNTIASYSFGIFFVHGYLLKLWNNIILKQLPITNMLVNSSIQRTFPYLLLSGITFIFIFLSSFIVCFLIKQLLHKLNIKNTRAFIGA